MDPAEMSPIERLLAEEGDSFILQAPRKFRAGKRWPWQRLTHALIHATELFEARGPALAAEYLEGAFPADFSLSGRDPLACEALAELTNLWGVCYRHLQEWEAALGLFDAVLRATDREQIRQYALYNRGLTRLRWALAGSGLAPTMSLRTTRRILRAAATDLDDANALDPHDAAACAQRGLVGLLLGSMTGSRVGPRLASYRASVEAYERALALQTDARSREAIVNNLTVARAGLEALAPAGWLRRTLGWSSTAPGSMSTDEAIVTAERILLTAQSEQVRRATRADQAHQPTQSERDDQARSERELGSSMDLIAQAEAVLNKAITERDDGTRERDPVIVAQRLLGWFDAQGDRATEGPASAPVEALWFLAAQGCELPPLAAPGSVALASLTLATQANQEAEALAILRANHPRPWSRWLCMHADSLLGRHFPIGLADLCLDLGFEPGEAHMEALGAVDPARCVTLLDTLDDPYLQITQTLPALLAAIDAGMDTRDLGERWQALRPEDLSARGVGEAWGNGEIRRLARLDLDAADRFRTQTLRCHDESPEAAVAFFARLARASGERALAESLSEDPPGAIALPRLLGCARAGVVSPDDLPVFLDELDGHGYAPHILFRHLVALCLHAGLAKLLAQVLARGGAHGWQLARAASVALREPTVRAQDNFGELLELLLRPSPAGPVAGRDASDGGVHVGQCELRPSWLEFSDPKPVEWLVLIAAIDDRAPWWGALQRPLP